MQVKQGLQNEYAEYVKINSDGGYSEAIIDAGEAVGKFLDEGKTPKEANEGLHGRELTGYMAGAAAQAIAYFHPRGQEFKKFWNAQFGVKDAEGTVNPAIVTISVNAPDSTQTQSPDIS